MQNIELKIIQNLEHASGIIQDTFFDKMPWTRSTLFQIDLISVSVLCSPDLSVFVLIGRDRGARTHEVLVAVGVVDPSDHRPEFGSF